MPGMPAINFPVTTKSPEAQAFINQGVGQLHGFWYYEAERSFRQAAVLDQDCAMAYWGMAMANVENDDPRPEVHGRVREAQGQGASERETMYIDALDAFFKADANKRKERAEAYTRALEKILYKYPDDIEAKALLALQLWKNRDAGIPIISYLAVDALHRPGASAKSRCTRPITTAFTCGTSSGPRTPSRRRRSAGRRRPGIAHMWHMPGHIYSKTQAATTTPAGSRRPRPASITPT